VLPRSIIKILPIYRGNSAPLEGSLWRCVLDDLIAQLLPCGCVTSVEAGGEAAGVNVSVLADLRFKVVTYGCVTSLEAVLGRPQESMLWVWQALDGGCYLRLCDLCGGWWGGCRGQCWGSGRPKMEVVIYGCVTSVEAGGEVAGVNVGGLAGLRWRLLPMAE
jgi:hypothetical protein